MQSGQSRADAHAGLHSIIPAGGAGTRLWPLSRQGAPKFLLDVLGNGVSLLESTVLRLAPISASVTIVTGPAHTEAVARQIQRLRDVSLLDPALQVAVVTEPTGRDSMPAIGLATALIARQYGSEAVVGSFAADHSIGDEGAFRSTVLDAVHAAQRGYITTIGIEPTSPSTAFGYIQPTDEYVAKGVQLVSKFVEKPPASVARQYIASGYLWNAGMFVMGAGTVLDHLRSLQPQMAAILDELVVAWGDTDAEVLSQIDKLWNDLPRIAIDHALAEPVARAGGVAVVAAPADVAWSDVGDFAALADMGYAEKGLGVGAALSVLIDSDGAFISAPADKVVAVLGIEDAIVVDSEDALLVTTKAQSQRVKEVVDTLRLRGGEKFT